MEEALCAPFTDGHLTTEVLDDSITLYRGSGPYHATPTCPVAIVPRPCEAHLSKLTRGELCPECCNRVFELTLRWATPHRLSGPAVLYAERFYPSYGPLSVKHRAWVAALSRVVFMSAADRPGYPWYLAIVSSQANAWLHGMSWVTPEAEVVRDLRSTDTCAVIETTASLWSEAEMGPLRQLGAALDAARILCSKE
jgi:hypothetical protein